jgi:hypothetical protein
MDGELSTWRLYLLRAAYLLIAAGLGVVVWPGLIGEADGWGLAHSIIMSMLGALGALALLGLRYPLAMLPLLFFELAWKVIWLARIGLPMWLQHRMDAGAAETARECLMVIVVPLAIPWDYVFDRYVRRRGDPWWSARPPRSSAPAARAAWPAARG